MRTSPNTTGLDAQKLQNLGSIESVVYGWLERGKVNGWEWKAWEGLEVSTDSVFIAIRDFCKESPRHRYDIPSDALIGRKLKQLIGANKKRKRIRGELENIYILPSINDARATFTAHMKLTNNAWIDENLAEESEESNVSEVCA